MAIALDRQMRGRICIDVNQTSNVSIVLAHDACGHHLTGIRIHAYRVEYITGVCVTCGENS